MRENKAGLRLVSSYKYPIHSSKQAKFELVSNNIYRYTSQERRLNARVYGAEKEEFLYRLVCAYNNSSKEDAFLWSYTQASRDTGLPLKKILQIKDFFVERGLFHMSPMYLSYTIDPERLEAHDDELCNILNCDYERTFTSEYVINEIFKNFEHVVKKYKEFLVYLRDPNRVLNYK